MNGTSITWWYDDRKSRWKNTTVEVIEILLKKNPKNIRKRGGKFHDLPLHYAIMLGASVNVVKYIGDAFPKAFKYESHEFQGDFPLHLAARFNPKTIKYMLYMDPIAVNVKDKYGKTPFDIVKEGKGNARAIQFFQYFYQYQ